MTEDDRLTRSPIVVIDLGSVLGRDGAHCPGSLSLRGWGRLTAGPAGRGGGQGQGGDARAGEKDPPAGRRTLAPGLLGSVGAPHFPLRKSPAGDRACPSSIT